MKLTANQLIILLDIHRGSFEESRHMGNWLDDLRYLYRRGLIKGLYEFLDNRGDDDNGDNLELTDDGKKRVREALEATEITGDQNHSNIEEIKP